MYLSQLILNPRSRQVRRELADVYELHRTVMQAFAGTLQPNERVLFRVDVHPKTGIPTLLVQSQHQPNWGFLLAPEKDYLLTDDDLPLNIENPAVKTAEVSLRAGQMLAFRLRANPTKRLGKDAGEKHHQRVGLIHEEKQVDWLKKKFVTAGVELLSVNIVEDHRASGKQLADGEKRSLRFVSVLFEGTLQVNDPQKLLNCVETGIGTGKGFGFGLLSLAPIR